MLFRSDRRRKIQSEYNKKHGITPKGIIKKIQETRLAGKKKEDGETKEKLRDLKNMTKQEVAYLIEELRDQMDLAARNLDIEKAASLRDQISNIREANRRVKHRLPPK